MRIVLTTALLGALVCGGCKKKAPETVEAKPPAPLAGSKIEPLTPPTLGGVTPMPGVEPTPAPAPGPAKPTPLTPLAPPKTVAKPAPGAPQRFYTVEKGDTLWKIAVRVYGDGQRYRDIQAANPGLVPNQMKIGQKLVLPPK